MRMRLLLICLVVLTLTGCSNFRASRRMNIAPFAESTINMVAEINYGLDARQAVHLRPYADGAPVQEYREHWAHYRPVLRNIGIYSLGLVTLSRSELSGPEQAQQMADFLERMFQKQITSGRSDYHLSPERATEILADIRAQDSLLNALGAAQPVVDEIARYSGEYLDIIKDSQDRTEAWLLAQIDQDYAEVLDFAERAKVGQNRALHELSLLSDYRQGRNDQGLEEVLQADRELAEYWDTANGDRYEKLQALEDRIVERLTRIQALKEQIAFDIDVHNQMTIELGELTLAADNNLRRTRMTVFVWVAAHRRLAAGITDPARFDMMSIAKKALDAAMPF